jgi:hypothetical protein
MDAEAIRTHPLERLFLPLDPHPKLRESQALAGIFPSLAVRAVGCRKAGVPVEPVRIGHERPQLLRSGAKVPFPSIVELWVAHLDLLPLSLLEHPAAAKIRASTIRHNVRSHHRIAELADRVKHA